jgi:protein-S-isoprenylcysteine O-methyltransferase Ste14
MEEKMKKILASLLITSLMLYVPLWGRFDLMLSPFMVFPTICSIWLLLKQHSLDWKKIKEAVKSDKYTTVWIMLGGMISQILPIIEWRYKMTECCQCLDFMEYLGILMMFGGTAIRLEAIDTLDKYFTNEVRIGKNWQLIQKGLYKFLRHPSYLGGFLAMIGTSVLFSSFYSFVFCSTFQLIIYFFRIRLEEKMLINHFGSTYQEYMKKTWAFIPFIY